MPSTASATPSRAKQQRLRATWVTAGHVPAEDAERVLGKPIEHEYSLFELLRRPDVSYASLMTLPGARADRDAQAIEQLDIQAKYQGYIDRQRGRGRNGTAPGRHASAGRPRLRRGARPVARGAAEAQPAPAGNPWPGLAHPGHHAGGDIAAAGASQEKQAIARRRETASAHMLPLK
jgi:hypothetical protein